MFSSMRPIGLAHAAAVGRACRRSCSLLCGRLHGKTIQGQGFQETRFLNQPPTALRTAVIDLKVEHKRRPASLEKAISNILEKEEEDLQEEFDRPDASSDRLYRSSFVHPLSMKTNCKETCGVSPLNLVPRPARTKRPHTPVLMKDALRRDELANKKKVLCFEMEAAGLMDDFPCLVVRGIWNYSDTHTNDEWQSYAALVAAAYAKELLKRIPPDHVEAEKRIADFLSAILNWLTPVENSTEHNDFIYRRQEGTGQWLLNSVKFQVWLNTDKQTLFCPGIPGAEETIMTAIVIDCLQEKFRDDQSVGIAYIYCSFQEQTKRPENLLASLLKQLAQRQSSLPRSVKDLYDRHTKDQTTPSFNEISRALHSVATTYSRVFIIIDALGECQISDDSQTRLVNRTKFLKEIFNLQDNVVANIFATSRPSKEIPDFFSKCLSLTITATDADILTYLNAKTSDIIDDEMRDTIRKGVLKAAGGMYFLLAQLHTHTLLSQLTNGHLKQALQALGKGMAGLDKTYGEAIGRIKDQGRGREVLAKRSSIMDHPLEKATFSTLELQHALAVQKNTTALDTDFCPPAELILSPCAGLVTINEETNIIRLVHYTTREYFERTWTSWFPSAQVDIAETCITYLSFDAFKGGPCQHHEFEARLFLSPLYSYAARNWGHHIPLSFLNDNLNLQSSNQRRKVGSASATEGGYDAVVRLLLKGNANVNAATEMENENVKRIIPALHLAAQEGHEAVVRLLLEHSADVNAPAEERKFDQGLSRISITAKTGMTALHLAATKGHTAAVRLLLREGADIDATMEEMTSRNWRQERRTGRTALHLAVARQHQEAIQLAHIRTTTMPTALHLAAKTGDEALVQLLLEKGANVNAAVDMVIFWGVARTALYLEAKNGYEVTVQLLIKNNANDGQWHNKGTDSTTPSGYSRAPKDSTIAAGA
ncbi:hypothetical protein F4823DRAFT_625894 [Ustulina deusta]|nr:hypothetical protein F4823DRAFT_625894 [Ustulina deusta]